MNHDPNESRAALGELKKYADSVPFKLIIRWLNNVIWDLRTANDNKDAPEVYRNQGRILEIKSLLNDLQAKRASTDDHHQGENPWNLE